MSFDRKLLRAATMQCLGHHWKLANTVFSEKKKRGGVVSRLTGGWRRSGSAYNELHNSASNLSPFPPRLSSLVFI